MAAAGGLDEALSRRRAGTARALASAIPYAFAKAHGVVPVEDRGESVLVLVRADVTLDGLAEARRVLGRPVLTREVDAGAFAAALARAYGGGGAEAGSAGAQLTEDLSKESDLAKLLEEIRPSEDLLESGAEAPVIRIVNALLLQALRERASDLHFEAYEARSVVRFRVDGMLREVLEPPRALHAALVSRLKIMASLDIAEKRLPQDGRITLRLGGRAVDVRVSTLPTGFGERVVLRLLDKESARLDLDALGMSGAVRERVDALMREPHGIVLVTGPTGSGKTTTLYACLSRLPRGQVNIMTVEDPIEYALEGVGQTQVNPRIELTFARALRSILRQDPDVIMIGEIRDLETAQIAVQASLTGHLVLATLHTNDATSAVTRLADMGIEPYLLASSLLGVLAQRLVRRLCPSCRVARAATEAERALLAQAGVLHAGAAAVAGAKPLALHDASGCDACGRSGYQGRTGIYELLQVDEVVRGLIHDRADERALRQRFAASGGVGLRADGVRWVLDGTTSLAELVRVTRA